MCYVYKVHRVIEVKLLYIWYKYHMSTSVICLLCFMLLFSPIGFLNDRWFLTFLNLHLCICRDLWSTNHRVGRMELCSSHPYRCSAHETLLPMASTFLGFRITVVCKNSLLAVPELSNCILVNTFLALWVECTISGITWRGECSDMCKRYCNKFQTVCFPSVLCMSHVLILSSDSVPS